MRRCNDQNPKAQDPDYVCNPATGRWVLRRRLVVAGERNKEKTCNPSSWKARSIEYRCNPATGRWNKISVVKRADTGVMVHKTVATAQKRQALVVPVAPPAVRTREKRRRTREKTTAPAVGLVPDMNYFLNMSTRDLRRLGIFRGQPAMSRERMIETLIRLISGGEDDTPRHAEKIVDRAPRQQKTPAVPRETRAPWEQVCKEMEQKCPMDTTLEGDAWCETRESEVIFHTVGDEVYCYKIEDIFRILHQGFTALDTSYQRPHPRRFQLPRDSFTRSVLPLSLMNLVVEKLTPQILTRIPIYPEVLHFLRHRVAFYRELQPFITTMNPDKVALSRAIEQFLSRDRKITLTNSRDLSEVGWIFTPIRRRRIGTRLIERLITMFSRGRANQADGESALRYIRGE